MTAAAIVQRASEEGLNLTLTPAGNIKAVGEGQAVARWLATLRKHKSEIINLLRVRSRDRLANSQWSTGDWLALYDERADIGEFGGQVSRLEAEDHAYEYCVVEWLNRHHETSPPGQCARCEQPDQPNHVVVPFGTDSHVWRRARARPRQRWRRWEL